MNQKTSSLITLIAISLVLCTFFISPITASKTLNKYEHVKINQCEKAFWWKDRKGFRKELKERCMEQRYDRHDKRKKRFRKGKDCDKYESWNPDYWKNKKNTWENLDKGKSLKMFDKVKMKSSQKLLWRKFQKVSSCKCAVLDYKVTNKAGISVCYQIASISKTTGEFVALITIFKLSKADKSNEIFLLGFKFDETIKVKTHGLKKTSDGHLFGLKPFFTFESKRGKDLVSVSKAFIRGKIPKAKSMNVLDIDDISPQSYEVVTVVNKTEKITKLKFGSEVKNIPPSKFTSYSSFFPYLDKEKNHNKNDNATKTTTPPKATTTPSNKDPNATPTPSNQDPNATTTPSNQDPNATPTPSNQDPNATPTPSNQDSTPTDQDQNATSTPTDQAQNTANSDTSSNTIAQANDQQSSGAPPLPGQTISAAPIGLAVFGAVVGIGAAFVGYTTYERRRYKKQFNRRQQQTQQNPSLAAVPEFGRAI